MTDTDTEQQLKWLAQVADERRSEDGHFYMLSANDIIANFQTVVEAERARLAAAGEMTDGEVFDLAGKSGGSIHYTVRNVDEGFIWARCFNGVELLDFARVLITDSAARATVVERERCIGENTALRESLHAAINIFAPMELGDSRAVSDIFVALAAVYCGDYSEPIMKVINDFSSAAAIRAGEER